ncbi:heavy metal translocating P-type ATPase [Guyparkeria sp.]|uniref:heavy metal translocating P-type ATPase n=1 Tax=Guyparkeria sp. TaxID=2035736 RepID=UPI0039710A28
MAERCFHCDLPVPWGERHRATVLDAERAFCCPGCQAVASSVVSAGLEDYYAHRDSPANRAPGETAEALIDRLRVFDNESLQRDFLTRHGDLAEVSLVLEEIRCAACLWLNEQQLRRLDGVRDVEIDYNSQQARVRYDPATVALSEILATIEAIGYHAHPFDPTRRNALLAEQRHRNVERLLFALILAMPIMAFSVAGYWMGGPGADGKLPLWEIIGRFSALIVTTLVLVYSGRDFLAGALRDLRNLRLGMDVPIALGLTVAWTGSVFATLQQSGEVYFDSIAMFVTFVLIARVIEIRGRLRAADAMDRLMRIIPRRARCWRDGDWTEVPVVELSPGDRLLLRPGEVVPVDATLRGDRAIEFDESVLTGESRPVRRQPGDLVIAGATNLDQPAELEVTRAEEQSMMATIHGLIRRGSAARPKVARLADRVASYFVAAVLVIAALTATWWMIHDPVQALANTVAVLIVTCPCALALATPVTLALSAGEMAGRHIIPQRMESVEALANADCLVFDKTGTLTEGRPGIQARESLDPEVPSGRADAIAHALESSSEHPLSRAFSPVEGEAVPAVDELRNQPGQGIEAVIDGERWRIGSPRFAGDRAMNGDGGDSAANTVVVLSRDGRPVARYHLADRLRPGVVEALERLGKEAGTTLHMLSGDRAETVAHLADKLGFDTAEGELTPERKLERVRQWQAEGRRVLMVGDGINDAPTLHQADASLSFSEATDLARQSADFLLTRADFAAVVETREIATRTRRTIRQNLTWAAGYNALAVPFAALGFVPPWLAAIGMSLSSIIVVGNAMYRFRRRRPDQAPRDTPKLVEDPA